MIDGKIIDIGDMALAEDDNLILFFGPTVTPGLRPYAVVQEITRPEEITLRVGRQILFGGESYQIQAVGSLAEANLKAIGHVTMVFGEVSQPELVNAIYLSPAKVPDFAVGQLLQYPGGAHDE
ncbi:PTS glucitol/sorbitol transporter subunit IIA [Enterococcus asini]|uniref:PTS glucitol/sorbitol transporter subunit IIA n=1 Tax=Enterococcus asini TaxID=57732 RepID=UPI0026DBF695|nr:PTS glucitol/sorbitol transporter subunit IIA [Enterococcus asini]